ncbi:MAG: PHP domain-containing protein [Gammaproteobacteria bacterium]
MSTLYDLHSHSTASDGTLSPTGLVEHAVSAGVDVLALTDHDTLDGLEEAFESASAHAVRIIPGVEISITWRKQTIHMLGLGIDKNNTTLIENLEVLQEFRNWRAEEIGKRLDKQGIPDALQGAKEFTKGRIVSRTHFAYFLVAAGHAKSIRDVFKRFLVPGKPGHVSGRWATLEDAVRWVTEAGGVTVIAHPARYRLTRTKLGHLLTDFKAAGGKGMEVVSGSHSVDEMRHMAALSREHDLLASQGSDYHGPEKPWVELGRLRDLPEGCKPLWQDDSWQQIHISA